MLPIQHNDNYYSVEFEISVCEMPYVIMGTIATNLFHPKIEKNVVQPINNSTNNQVLFSYIKDKRLKELILFL